MRGVVIKQAQVVSDDSRRKIISILNGEIGVRDIHILEMKKGETIDGFVKLPLGNHHHFYPEIMYVYKGKCKYWLKNQQGEEMECEMKEGDIMFRAPGVVHTCVCSEDAILIDGSSESWISEDWNHVREVLKS